MLEAEPYKNRPLLLGTAPRLNNNRVWYFPKEQNLSMHIMGLPGKGKSRFMQSMINDMERIADIYFQISKLSERMLETKTQWPQEAVEDLNRIGGDGAAA